ncbi:MAG: sulfite exporter TauE/SafE family protein [Gaiellales bacterium]
MSHELVAVLLGAVAGTLSALFGVGGGVIFVPTLIFLGHSPHVAVATSLVAMVPVIGMGAWRQTRYGSVRWRDAVVIGAASVPTAKLGEVVATSLSNEVLRRLFAVVLAGAAVQLAYRALHVRETEREEVADGRA